MVFGAPSGSGDRSQPLDSAACEFTNAARSDPLISEEWEGILQALGKSGQRRIRGRRILMQELDPQAGRQVAVAMQREKWVVHRVRVLIGQAAGWRIRMKCAAVAMRRDAKPRVI